MGGRHTWQTQLGTRAGRSPPPPPYQIMLDPFLLYMLVVINIGLYIQSCMGKYETEDWYFPVYNLNDQLGPVVQKLVNFNPGLALTLG
jgi:hypothetical protein